MMVFSQRTTDRSYSSWSSIILDYKLNHKFYVKNEAHYRRTKFLKDWQQLLIRPSVHYKYNNTLEFSAGYSYAKNFGVSYDINENNVWEQVLLSHTSGKSKFKHRFRFEQRFIDQLVEIDNGVFTKVNDDFKMRFRYRFTWGMPLVKVSKNKHIDIAVFDEVWLNTDSGIVPKSLNQNWFYVGVSYPILKKASLGIGYMNDYVPLNDDSFKSNHILQTTLKYHI